MKNVVMVLAFALMGTVLAGLSGCKKEAKATPEAALEKAAEQPAAALPAAQKPKDHPAH